MTVYYKELTVEAPSRPLLRTIARLAECGAPLIHEPPLLARYLRVIGRIVAAQWKWLIATGIAIVGLFIR